MDEKSIDPVSSILERIFVQVKAQAMCGKRSVFCNYNDVGITPKTVEIVREYLADNNYSTKVYDNTIIIRW